MAEQFEAANKAPQAASEEHHHNTWAETASNIYHSAMQTVGLEEAPKPLEFKTLERKTLDLSRFTKELEFPKYEHGKSARMLDMEYSEELSKTLDPCMRQYFSKARQDPKDIDTSCFEKDIKDRKLIEGEKK